ncbi:MAG: hypothetical protein KKC19_02015 [Nanoarchaeota archaeon]|nr:hypothetical protein [Nanoarchaeota archaeon]
MEEITLKQVNENVIGLRRELEKIKDFLEESNFELNEDVKSEIEESRKRSLTEFKTQEEIEKKFL